MSTALAFEAAPSAYDVDSLDEQEEVQPFWSHTILLLDGLFQLERSVMELARSSYARALRGQPFHQVEVVSQLDLLQEQRNQQQEQLDRLLSVGTDGQSMRSRSSLLWMPLALKSCAPLLRRAPFLTGVALLTLMVLSQVLLAELSRQAVRAQRPLLATVLMDMLRTSLRAEPQLRMLVRQHAQGTWMQRRASVLLIHRLASSCDALVEKHIQLQKQGLESHLHTDQASLLLALQVRKSQLRDMVREGYVRLASVMPLS